MKIYKIKNGSIIRFNERTKAFHSRNQNMKEKKTETLRIRITPSYNLRLFRKAEKQKKSVSTIITRMIQNYLRRGKK